MICPPTESINTALALEYMNPDLSGYRTLLNFFIRLPFGQIRPD